MNQKTALAALLIVLVCSVSIVTCAAATSSFPSALPQIQDSAGHQRLIFAAIAVGTSLHGNSKALDQPTRLEIYNFVRDNPGVHFRGICEVLGLSVGVVQYHLGVLEQAGLVSSYADGQNRRYFERNFAASDVALTSLLRHETPAKILTALTRDDGVLHRDLVRSLGVSSQALTWQMNQLKKAQLVTAEKAGVNVKYGLNPASANAVKLALNLIGGSRT
jgi:predicted transcriptional regulator